MEFGLYRKHHSTETAMLRVWWDIMTSADVSAAVDCVDHRLQSGCGSLLVQLVPRWHGWISIFLSSYQRFLGDRL